MYPVEHEGCGCTVMSDNVTWGHVIESGMQRRHERDQFSSRECNKTSP